MRAIHPIAPAVIAALVAAAATLPAAGARAQMPDGSGVKVAPESKEEITLSFAPVVRESAPAVLNVYTEKVIERRIPPLFDDPFFRRFFGDQLPFSGPGEERRQTSLGSGVVVDKAGTIVTNSHVIAGADQITVKLADRREFDAQVIYTDKHTDLTVMRIETGGEDLPYLRLGDSDELEVGDLVLAIGNPFGVGQTVTSGIVSALARTKIGISDYRSFIQTDAAINPGNSGGALVNMKGELVGINSAIFTRSGGSLGIGFAIPSNMVKVVVRQALAEGRVVRPWLGASGQTVTGEIAESLGMDRPRGVIVNRLHPQSPAAEADLRVGDVVTEVNGRPVDDIEVLRFRIATLETGGTARLTVWRQGRTRIIEVPLVAPPEVPPRNLTTLTGRQPLAGATVANLSPALADEMGLDDTLTGVIIVEIKPGSPAHRFNFKPGDILKAVNGQEVEKVSQAKQVLSRPAESWRITVNRGGRTLSATIHA